MDFAFLNVILIILLIALLVTVLFRQLHLPVILGYLLVGALVGPHALGLAPNSEDVAQLAEFGIVFLMFTIGLEFSLPKLFSLRYTVFIAGTLQVLLTISITAFIGIYLDMTALAAIIVGGIVAMSSTAIVTKELNDQLELNSPHGLNAVGILLFQDLAVIPIIILIASFSHNNAENLFSILGWALSKGLFAIFLIAILGRWLLKPLLHFTAKTRTVELFTLTALLVTLSAAQITNLFGLSYALGAFLAGIMLSETEFRHQVEVEIRPFRDILLGLFFISIGMLTNVHNWHEIAMWVGLLVIALTIGKLGLIFLISRVLGNSLSTSLRTGLVLAQGGEFGFAILTLALKNNSLPQDYGQVILAALIISLMLSPLLIHFNKKISGYLLPKAIQFTEDQEKKQISAFSKKLKRHIIICGYGRVGQHIAHLLDKIDFPYIALDLDAELVKRASLAGEPVIYGNPAHPDILRAAGLDYAKVLVISFNDLNATIKVLGIVNQTHPHLPIIVRCRDELELIKLKQHGATRVISEIFEESLTISSHLLNAIHIPAHKITELMQEIRNKDYDLLLKVFTSDGEEKTFHNGDLRKQLKPVLIPDDAYAIGKQLKAFSLKATGVEVIAIRRGESKQFKPRNSMTIHANDIIILYGLSTHLEEAERRLLEGMED